MKDYPAKYHPKLYPSQTPAGLWKLHEMSPEYAAWKAWLRAETDRTYFTEPIMVVWFRWPPDTQEGADYVFDKINQDRASPDKWSTKKHEVINPSPLTKRLKPWDPNKPMPQVRDRRFTPIGQEDNQQFGWR